jgi:hypothetical protein
VEKWVNSDEFKAIRKWQNQQGQMIEDIGQLTKECKNNYDVIFYYNLEKTWFGGHCYHCCELARICKKGVRKEVFKEESVKDE